MNADAYQTAAARTLIDRPDSSYSDHETMIVWNALGLAGEAGELANDVKKLVFHRHGEITHDRLADEMGDVLWYVAALATKLGYTLSEVMERNIAKLQQRYPNGYASADSKARVDVAPAKQTVQSLLDQHTELPVWVSNAVMRAVYRGNLDDNADLFLEIVKNGNHNTLKSIGTKGMEILQKELLPPAPEPPAPSGRKADILSALQYYGPLTARQIATKLNKPVNQITSSLTSLWRNEEVERELIQFDNTDRRYYRYTAYGADCQPITRGATPLIRG